MPDPAAITVRAIAPEELLDWYVHNRRSFAEAVDRDQAEAMLRPVTRYEDCLAAFDGTEIVGTAHLEPTPMSMPGGAWLDCAAVTRVSVAPTHRRRGILRQLMTVQLQSVQAQGLPLASLWASESPIYGRFGYGMAGVHETWRIAREHTAFASWAPEPRGEVRFVDAARWPELLPPLFDEYAGMKPGGMKRVQHRWDRMFEDRDRRGMSPLQGIVHRTERGVDGYALYRSRSNWPRGAPDFEVRLEEMVAFDSHAELDLWRVLLNLDLAGSITAVDQPTDATLPWALADFRRLQRRQQDGIYVRVVDLPAAFEARAYRAAGRLVIEIDDPVLPDAGGRFAIEASPEGAAVTRTSDAPQLRLHPAAAGMLLLGGRTATLLARAGLIEERESGALERADELFRWPAAPHTLYHF